MTLDLTHPEHLENRLRVLVWELMRVDEGTLRTWADYGFGKIETTAATRVDLEEKLLLLRTLVSRLGFQGRPNSQSEWSHNEQDERDIEPWGVAPDSLKR
jgi:hypothetical protein